MKRSVFFFLMLSFSGRILTEEKSIQSDFFVPSDIPKTSYKIDAHVDIAEKKITGNEVITFKNSSSKPLSIIAINHYHAKKIKINIKGKSLEFLHGKNGSFNKPPFFYKLPKTINPGKNIKLDVEFSSKIEVDETSDQAYLVGWHPTLWWNDIPSQKSFKAKISIPEDYSMAISGRLNKKSGYYENNSVTTHFGAFLSKNLKAKEKEVEGVLVTSLFTEKGRECATLLLETAVDVIKFYKKFHGFYPFNFLYIIPGSSCPMGGCPYASGIVRIHGQEQFKEESLLHWRFITAHEIGHQYWGEYVMPNKDIRNIFSSWLMIGMGIYLDREYIRFKKLGMGQHKKMMNLYLEGVKEHYDITLDAPPSLVKKQKYNRNNVLKHGKGFSVFSALGAVLGRDTFKRAYMKCVKNYGGNHLGYKDLQKIFEKETNESLGWFFQQWVRSNKYLYYAIESSSSVKKEDTFISSVKIVRGRPFVTISMPIPVKAIFEDGSSQIKYTNRHLEINTIKFESKSKLKRVILDPEHELAMLKKPLAITVEEIPDIISKLDLVGSSKEALKIFKKYKKDITLSAKEWLLFGVKLYDGGYYEEAFEACKNGSKQKARPFIKFVIFAWMGILKDLMEKRKEAIKYYAESLKQDFPESYTADFDVYNLEINRQWTKERLKTPFTKIK